MTSGGLGVRVNPWSPGHLRRVRVVEFDMDLTKRPGVRVTIISMVIRNLRILLAIAALVPLGVATGQSGAQEVLHIRSGFHSDLIREDMRGKRGMLRLPKTVGYQSFLASWSQNEEEPRNYRSIPLVAGKRVEWAGYSWQKPQRTKLSQLGFTMGVKSPGGGGGDGIRTITIDVDSLKQGPSPTYCRVRTADPQIIEPTPTDPEVAEMEIALRPNCWQEILSTKVLYGDGADGVSLWCYLEVPGLPPAPPSSSEARGSVDGGAMYLVDVIYGYLPDAALDKAHFFTPEHTGLAVKQMWTWSTHTVACLPGKPFAIAFGAGEVRRVANWKYHNDRLSRLIGEISASGAEVTLKCDLHTAIPRYKDNAYQHADVISFSGGLKEGEWKLHRIVNDDGPRMHGMGARGGAAPRVNVMAMRVVGPGQQ